jgi:pimeloyl-ACP methyl ester carboxylesterase
MAASSQTGLSSMLDSLTQSSASRIDVGGVGIELWSQGKGPALLFLHPGDGFNLSARFIQTLAQNFRVLAPSHPGFGGSALPSHMRTVDDLSYFYLDLMETLNLTDVVIVGVSFGAWIAAEIATKCCHNISGLVFIDALGVKFGDRLTQEIADLFSVEHYNQAQMFFHDEKLRRHDFENLSDEDLLLVARNYESFALFGWSPTLHNPKLLSRLHRIKKPAIVVWGEHDRVVSVDYGRKFAAAIPSATFEVVAGAGHYPHVERANEVSAIVNRAFHGAYLNQATEKCVEKVRP